MSKLTRKELNTILKRKNNEDTLIVVEEKLDNMKNNKEEVEKEIREDKALANDILLIDPKDIEAKALLEDAKKNENLVKNWITPTITDLRRKRLLCLKEIKKEEIKEAKKALKKDSGKK